MIGWLTFIAGIFALFDLFSDKADRVLPWWGDVIVMAGALVGYLVADLISRIYKNEGYGDG